MIRQYKFDPAHSSAQFTVRHMMITNVRGSFSGVEGTVAYDPEHPEQTTLQATIKTATVNTQEPQRDADLRSPAFLDVEKYPTMTFTGREVTRSGDGELRIVGDLTLHGVTKPVTLNVEGPTDEAKDPWGNFRIGAAATTKIKRSDFGLTYNQVLETGGFLVGDELKIALDVSLIRV